MNFYHESIAGEVAMGKDRELFLLSQRHETLRYWIGEKRADIKSIENFSECLKQRKCMSENLGVSKYMHLIVPDKHVVYDSALPFPLKYSLGKDYAAHLDSKIAIYPLREFQAALSMHTYRRTDSHWSGQGNALAASLIASQMGFSTTAVEVGLCELRSCIRVVDHNYSGDLGSKLAISQSEALEKVVPTWRIITHESNVSGNEGMLCLQHSTHPDSIGRLVIFGDSFMFQSLPALSRYFREILCCRTRNFHHEIVKMAKPDFVLTENVERYLTGPGDDRNAPPFMLIPYLRGKEVFFSHETASALSDFLRKGNMT